MVRPRSRADQPVRMGARSHRYAPRDCHCREDIPLGRLQSVAAATAAKDAEIARLRGGLEAISDLLDGEIKIRWRDGQSNMNESEAAGNSTLYSLLSVPRNIARAALSEAREAGVAHAITPFPSGGATSFDPS